MTKRHDKRPRGVAEPVQVYLDPGDRRRLERLVNRLGVSKSDALRQGLAALEREQTDPASHPALRIIGVGAVGGSLPSPGYDLARDHDRYLAESEIESWRASRGRKHKRDRARRRGS